ncbi:MAG: CRISPR-associated protein Cas4 [Ardenticatenales bacterium]|nr:CRISPR-associated protein Cas4 [Ardenticatenales bacterium]
MAALVLLIALLLWGLAGWMQRRTGLPRARVRYDDASEGRVPERPLVSHTYKLTGRPDYLLEHRGRVIPVEVKPRRQAEEPYASDLMQLAAYCLLVEETYGQRPPYGILRYARKSWEIPFDNTLRQSLLKTLELMAQAEQMATVKRSHNHAPQCAACSQRANCDQRLA